MAALWIISVALVAAGASASPSRIVGGQPTSVEEYPSIVQVESQGIISGAWSQSCAGSILTSRTILSAAHCFDGIFYHPMYRRIRAGATTRNSGGVVINVEKEFNHPSYGHNGYDGDISVVRLQSALTYTPEVQRAAIAAFGTMLPGNLPVVHAGWGAVSQGGPASPVLMDVTIYTVDHALCAERYQSLSSSITVTENMICAGILDVGGKDACQGDSGGPLYFNNVIVGVVSWGYGCAHATYPGVSTAVSPYAEWIRANTI